MDAADGGLLLGGWLAVMSALKKKKRPPVGRAEYRV